MSIELYEALAAAQSALLCHEPMSRQLHEQIKTALERHLDRMADGPDYGAAIAELKRYRRHCTVAELEDADWIIKELAHMGYAISLQHATPADFQGAVDQLYRTTRDGPRLQRQIEEGAAKIIDAGGFYVYRLIGEGPAARIEHRVPDLLLTLQQALLSAFLNAARLDWQEDEPDQVHHMPGQATDANRD